MSMRFAARNLASRAANTAGTERGILHLSSPRQTGTATVAVVRAISESRGFARRVKSVVMRALNNTDSGREVLRLGAPQSTPGRERGLCCARGRVR
jgi:hypothetical protein